MPTESPTQPAPALPPSPGDPLKPKPVQQIGADRAEPEQDGWHRTKPWQCQHVQMTHRTTVFRGYAVGFMGWAPCSRQGELTLDVHSALWDLHKQGLGALHRLLSPSSCPARAGLSQRNVTVSQPHPLEMSELPRKDEKKHKTHTMLDLDCA